MAKSVGSQDAGWAVFQPDGKAAIGGMWGTAADDGETLVVDLEDQMLRTEHLRDIKLRHGEIWWPNSAHAAAVAERLADLSKDRESPDCSAFIVSSQRTCTAKSDQLQGTMLEPPQRV
jgi:hypothetical protein